jgi:hypothetical protein
MAIIKDTHETNTYTPESGLKSLETLADEAKVIDTLAVEVVTLHKTNHDPESYDAAVMTSLETGVRTLGEHADQNTLDNVTLIAAGAVTDPHLNERLFRTVELSEDDVLRSVWTKSLDIRQYATSADEEQHALDSMLEATITQHKQDKPSARRISSLAVGLLSHYPGLASKYVGHLIDAS